MSNHLNLRKFKLSYELLMRFWFSKSWEDKNIKAIDDNFPFIPSMFPMLELSKFRLENVMERHSIPRIGNKGRCCLAFYLGTISGEIRQTVNVSKLDDKMMLHLILTSYGYVAIKSGQVKSDSDWASVITRAEEVLLTDEYVWFHRKGIGSVGILGEDPEENWLDFENEIRT
ncbi:hypothetical protein [Vibrio sinaloensis]|uniref:hypothetical protein n=1 Tax=Photobacterium sp. (strain ATCC 43367) TaxID=379097 RepID=UPI002F3EE10A